MNNKTNGLSQKQVNLFRRALDQASSGAEVLMALRALQKSGVSSYDFVPAEGATPEPASSEPAPTYSYSEPAQTAEAETALEQKFQNVLASFGTAQAVMIVILIGCVIGWVCTGNFFAGFVVGILLEFLYVGAAYVAAIIFGIIAGVDRILHGGN